jgi:hypothetical protein
MKKKKHRVTHAAPSFNDKFNIGQKNTKRNRARVHFDCAWLRQNEGLLLYPPSPLTMVMYCRGGLHHSLHHSLNYYKKRKSPEWCSVFFIVFASAERLHHSFLTFFFFFYKNTSPASLHPLCVSVFFFVEIA